MRDPNHINIVTHRPHRYFTKPDPMARMYGGFEGRFHLVRQCWMYLRGAYALTSMGMGDRLKRLCENLTGQQSHLVWEISANKKAGQ